MAKLLRWTMRDLIEVIDKTMDNKFDEIIFIDGNRGTGKTQKEGNKVLLRSGNWKKVEDIKIGDELISPQENGSFTYSRVINIHSRFEKDCYDVREATRQHKVLYSCAGNHDIPYFRTSHPRRKEDNKRRLSIQVLDLKEARELSKQISASRGSHIIGFTTTAVDYDQKDCCINPYSLGVWLGNGYYGDSLSICSNNPETIDEIPYPIMNIYNKENTTAKEYRYSTIGEFAGYLSYLGLRYKTSGLKFIPESALLSSYIYRLELLAGLIDTDGYVSKIKSNCIIYTTKSKQLSYDIRDLVFSLGGYANIKEIEKSCQNGFKGKYYNVNISFEKPEIIPLRNKFKKIRLGKKFKHNPRHIAIEVVKSKPSMVYGFELDPNQTKSQWYITDNWMITHNSTLAFKVCRGVSCGFKPKNDIVFKREEVLRALASKKKSIIFGDELINVAYNRDFYLQDQKALNQALNMYRDSCNCFIGCVPNFTNLDNQIRQLCKLRITIIRRGVAIIHRPIKSIYVSDKWDIKNNQKIEQKAVAIGKPIPYSKFTTACGILVFGDLSPSDRELYESIKEEKRNQVFGDYIPVKTDEFLENMYKELVEYKLTKEKFEELIRITGKNPKSLRENLNRHLTADGKKEKVPYFFYQAKLLEKEKNKIAAIPQKQLAIVKKFLDREKLNNDFKEFEKTAVVPENSQETGSFGITNEEKIIDLTLVSDDKTTINEVKASGKQLRERLLRL